MLHKYYENDYLCYVRVVTDADEEVLEHNDYSGFGQRRESSTGSANRYRYNGKEEQATFGTPYSDYGARQYSSASGRWLTVDPLTEKYYSYSPYAFCNNNPVNFVDPDGNHPVIAGAIIGGAISGTAAIIKGKSFTEVIAATTGGAVDGALAASGAKLVTKIALGATGSGLGDIAEQGINIICDNQESFDWESSIVSTILGMASTGITESIETGLKSVAESLISSRTT